MIPIVPKTALFRAVFIILIAFASGCAVTVDYPALESLMSVRNCPHADALLDKSVGKYGSNARLVYLMDNAMVKMLCGDYVKSNVYLQEAQYLSEDLYTKSLSKEAASILLNDFARPYEGEDFEKAMLYLFSAINYLNLQKYDDALVECRKLDLRLNEFNSKYEKKNVYKEDAFGRYLSAMIHESYGNIDDAYIDYYKAYTIYKDYRKHYGTSMPKTLLSDLYRSARLTGRLDSMRSELDINDSESFEYPKGHGRVVLIQFTGKAPFKVEESVHIMTKEGPIKIPFPKFVSRRPNCSSGGLRLNSSSQPPFEASAEMVEDISAIAVKNLDDRKGRVIARTIAQVVAKRIAINVATSKMKEKDALRFILNVVDDIAISKADTRSWRTLPAEIYMTSLFVPEGSYEPFALTCGGASHPLNSIKVRAGKTAFLLFEALQ